MPKNNELFSVLIVDDEPHARTSVKVALRTVGVTNTIECGESTKVMDIMRTNSIGVVILDLIMPVKTGEQLLKEISLEHPDVIVIIVTGTNEIETAVDCMKLGAFDYILKPLDNDRLTTTVIRAIDVYDLRMENASIKRHFLEGGNEVSDAFMTIVTANDKMRKLFKYCEAVSNTRQPILVTGETGVGKELFAKALHDLSGRRGEFVAVNVAGLDSNMFSDTLFGHVKGAFTGAENTRAGLIEKAADGTLFLDEIGDLDEESQVKMLRLLQEHEYSPLGADMTKISRARVIVATHKDLERSVAEQKFRRDLFYRLRTHLIEIPPLKERLDDVGLLLEAFIEETCHDQERKPLLYPAELITLLKNYHYPGNIRELKAMVVDAVSRCQAPTLPMASFRNYIEKNRDNKISVMSSTIDTADANRMTFPRTLPTLKEMNELLIQEALRRADNNQSMAARFLGITQQALSLRIKKMKPSEKTNF